MEEFKDYEEILEKLNIVEKDDGEYIGEVKDIIQLYLYFIKGTASIKDMNDLEDRVNNIELYNNFIEDLMELNENLKIETFYNPMGAFEYLESNS